MLRTSFIVLAAFAASCSSPMHAPAPAHEPAPAPRPTPPPAPIPSDAPSSTACAADAECVVLVSAPDPADGCCDYTVTMLPTSQAYVAFVARWRESHCAGRVCAPGSLPGAQGAPCAYEARCVEGACTSACGSTP